ncbi:MAG: HEAT repeat domain-containing protein [Nitrospirae bacterium]|nr:HEAT repeat domain-containing protein [Nitrospirota bacterium]
MLLYNPMESFKIDSSNLKKLIADYMENGFLENIEDMFKHDSSLYAFIGDLIKDDRIMVRLGISALIETLKSEDPENISRATPSLLPLLKNQNPLHRCDAAYLLGMIGNKDIIPYLRELENDEDENVRIIVKESIKEIETRNP